VFQPNHFQKGVSIPWFSTSHACYTVDGNPDARRVLRHPFFCKIFLCKHDLAKQQNPTRGSSMLSSWGWFSFLCAQEKEKDLIEDNKLASIS